MTNRGIYFTQPTTTCCSSSRSGRHICPAHNPWKWGMGRAVRPDAIETGEQQGGWHSGDVQGYKCRHCGPYFDVELPQYPQHLVGG